jgi:cellulose synthase/poly-beta-1,6-N-acetylglucosamine synthase-like glycosyltransferase
VAVIPSLAESTADAATWVTPPAVPAPPRLSVIVPVYDSEATLGRSLQSLVEQTHAAYEVIVVDSSPGEACSELVRREFPTVTLLRSRQRLLPHAARNLGVAQARGELLVFTDPDIYAPPQWLEHLAAAHEAAGGVIVGALACHGNRWLDRAIHLVKFSKWLPTAAPRAVDVSPTANMLCPRWLFTEVGGFRGDQMLGDATFSWELRRRGHLLQLDRQAWVEHHHVDTLGGFLGERYRRGILYGGLRLATADWRGRGPGARLAAVPLRIASNVLHTLWHAWSGRQLGWFVLTWPVVLAGHVGALAGEAVSYWRALFAARAARSR